MIDLYFDVIKRATEWPLPANPSRPSQNTSDSTGEIRIPQELHPSSGIAAGYETSDPAIKQRILDYNEDDCLATGIVVDGIRALPVTI